MSGEPRCKKCGKLKLDHNRGFYGRWFCDDEETLFEPAEPSPAPQAERVIEVAPQEDTPALRNRMEMFGEEAGAYIFRLESKLAEAESALTAAREDRDRAQKLAELHNDSAVEANQRSQEYMTKYDRLVADGWDVLKKVAEERDRAQDALRAIRLRVNRQFAVKTIDEYFALKPVSDRQPPSNEEIIARIVELNRELQALLLLSQSLSKPTAAKQGEPS